jgi:iron-sulfur cluster assembly accessory protein
VDLALDLIDFGLIGTVRAPHLAHFTRLNPLRLALRLSRVPSHPMERSRRWDLNPRSGGSKVPLRQAFLPLGDLMATATVAPAQETEKKAPLTLTPQAIAKVREIMATQDPLPAGLRIGVVGGGCSGFQYSMAFENQAGMMDKVFPFEDLKVFVDATSLMYLNGCIVDYVETLEAAGFKFDNPQVKSTCGCGSSFSV